MTLESLPDIFNEATHEKLDLEVNAGASQGIRSTSPPLSSFEQYFLLNQIIVFSKGDLDPKYLRTDEFEKLAERYGELRTMLMFAWEQKSYRSIRNLAFLMYLVAAILKKSSPPQQSQTTFPQAGKELQRQLSESFTADYHGAAIEGFYEYLTHNELLFREEQSRYYARFCSIVQSSGTGKSRLLVELSKKDVVVLYMNLRETSDIQSFPARDPIPADILCTFPAKPEQYQPICYAFFIALFEALNEQLSQASVYATRQARDDTMHWVREMCDLSPVPKSATRVEFFRKFSERYTKISADIARFYKGQTEQASSGGKEDAAESKSQESSGVEAITTQMQHLSVSESKSFLLLLDVYKELSQTLERIFVDDSGKPKLVIAIDEAHPLTPTQSRRGREEQYRPAEVLCKIISGYSQDSTFKYPIWVVFASTTSRVADLSPPNHKHNSSRVHNDGQLLFPPYTQLGWDHRAADLGEIDMDDISRMSHLVGYGRPLWQSVRKHRRAGIVLRFAESKLCANEPFDPKNTSHVLAVLGQRFGLNVTVGHPDSIAYLESGVASHLRICLSTTLDRVWRFTSYPSEPFLSYAAAIVLHRKRSDLVLALDNLYNVVNRGMIDQRGELAGRLLWLLSKDLYVRKCGTIQGATGDPAGWAEHAVDCRMVRVVDWLEFVFGPQIWGEDSNQASLARKTFDNAYLNFSHWICMDANIAGLKEGDEIDLHEWTLRHWQRTCAVQCCHNQPLIDKAIPIYFKGEFEGTSTKPRMSQIFISDKDRKSSSSKNDLHSITRRHVALGGEDSDNDKNRRKDKGRDTDSPPYIVIMADLAQPPSFSLTFPERETSDRCLRIYAAGVDTETYPFLDKYPELQKILQNFVRLQEMPESDWPYTEYLNVQVKYGSTATAEHMHWERGKVIPTL